MPFQEYNRFDNSYDEETRAVLRNLCERFGTVEMRKLDSGEWCLRVLFNNEALRSSYHVAAMGKTVLRAGKRLLQLAKL